MSRALFLQKHCRAGAQKAIETLLRAPTYEGVDLPHSPQLVQLVRLKRDEFQEGVV